MFVRKCFTFRFERLPEKLANACAKKNNNICKRKEKISGCREIFGLEKTSNFRISLDLFELATIGTNFDLQTAGKALTGCTKMAPRYFGPFLAKRRLQMIGTLVFFLVRTLLSKMPQAQKSNGLRSEDFGGHCAAEIKRGTFFLSHSWLTCAECGGAEICWNVHSLRPKCLSAQGFNTVFKTFSR